MLLNICLSPLPEKYLNAATEKAMRIKADHNLLKAIKGFGVYSLWFEVKDFHERRQYPGLILIPSQRTENTKFTQRTPCKLYFFSVLCVKKNSIFLQNTPGTRCIDILSKMVISPIFAGL
jgi:hypothetical protein